MCGYLIDRMHVNIFSISGSSSAMPSRCSRSHSFWQVWLGEYHGHEVAIKRLKKDVPISGLLDFEREIELMCTLRHENIVFFFGAGKKNSVAVCVWLNGVRL